MAKKASKNKKEIDKLRSEFVSIVSHQLRTPLSSMKWFLEILISGEEGRLNPKQSDIVNEIYSLNKRMTKLVNDLLKVAQIEEKKIFLTSKLTQIEDVFKNVVLILQTLARARNVEIINKLTSKKLPKIKIDPDKIEHAVLVIVDNAVRYNKPGGKVYLNYKREKQQVVFSIKDTGIGIPLKEQKKVFQKFFRAKNVVKARSDGTGLGLFIAKAVIEASSGKIWFESKENVGTTFYFSLPIKLD